MEFIEPGFADISYSAMAERGAASADVTLTSYRVLQSEDDMPQNTVRLTLKKPESKKKVQWQSGTVDNENMNKKKSKCCCQYEKPRAFEESSSSSEDECENCHGHVERKKKNRKDPAVSTGASAELDPSAPN